MKKLLLPLCIWFITSATFAQMLFTEEFSYNTGQLSAANSGANVSGGNWTTLSGTNNYLSVEAGNLIYSGYPSSNIGNSLRLTASALSSEDVSRSFLTTATGSIYVSFLISIWDTATLVPNSSTTGDYFMALQPTNYYARLCVKKGVQPGMVQFGIRANSTATVAWSGDVLGYNTNLIVFSYDFITGGANDIANLWVNPTLSQTPPTPTATSFSTSDVASINSIAIRQNTNTPGGIIDGIRVATSWNSSPLPVLYKYFTASKFDNHATIKWATTSENNNKGFEIQRSGNGTKYQTIGFVKTKGTTQTGNVYQYTDYSSNTGNVCYRLKQIDVNGDVEFSKIACVHFDEMKTTEEVVSTPNPFNDKLHLNYTSLNEGTVNIQIIDMIGKLYLDNNQHANRGENVFSFETANLPVGIYFIRLSNNGVITTHRIVKR